MRLKSELYAKEQREIIDQLIDILELVKIAIKCNLLILTLPIVFHKIIVVFMTIRLMVI